MQPGYSVTDNHGGIPSLDLRPLPAPVSPFAWYADQLRGATYPTPEARDQARGMIDWLQRCAAAMPTVVSRDPVELTALARYAANAAARGNAATVINGIEALIASVDGGRAPSVNGALHGFKV